MLPFHKVKVIWLTPSHLCSRPSSKSAIPLPLLVVLTELRARGLHLVLVAGAPRNSAGLSIVHLLVVLDHVFVNFGSLPVDILILLVELIAVLVTLVVELVDGFRMVPVLVRLEVIIHRLAATIQVVLLWTTCLIVVEAVCYSLTLTVEIIDAGNCILFVTLVVNCVVEVAESGLLLPDLGVE